MMFLPNRGVRAFAAAACILAAGGALVAVAPAAAAEPATSSATMPDPMGQAVARHFRAHLDHLADRMEIKASQENAWQAFGAALIDVMAGHHPPAGKGHPPMDADAATIARTHAERAAEHAQKLARLADATAALQQLLSPEQRLVFDEAARRFAQAQFGHHGEMGHGDMGHGAMAHGTHCEGADPHHGHERGEHGGPMHSDPAGPGAEGAEFLDNMPH